MVRTDADRFLTWILNALQGETKQENVRYFYAYLNESKSDWLEVYKAYKSKDIDNKNDEYQSREDEYHIEYVIGRRQTELLIKLSKFEISKLCESLLEFVNQEKKC